MLGLISDLEFQKRGVFFKIFRYLKKGSFFLNNDENNSSDNLY